MAFNLEGLIKAVDRDAFEVFLTKYGDGRQLEWQNDPGAIAQDVVDALHKDDWALDALENCELIAAVGGRDVLRCVQDWRTDLLALVDDLEATDLTCAVRLASADRKVFDRLVSITHAVRGLGTKSWDAFKLTKSHSLPVSCDIAAIDKFKSAVEHVLKSRRRQVPVFRDLHIDHFHYAIPRRSTHTRRPWVQFNILATTSPAVHEYLAGGALTKIKLPGLYRAAIIFDPERRTIEVVAKGGKPVRDALVDAFLVTMLPPNEKVDRLVRRKINFDIFKCRPQVDRKPDDPILIVDEIRLFSPDSDAGLITIECKREERLERDVYDKGRAWFGELNPIGRDGWTIVAVRVRLQMQRDRDEKSSRIITVDLKSPMGTNLREKSNADHEFAADLLTRWGIFDADSGDE